MEPLLAAVLLPNPEVRLHVYPPQPVPGDHVKIAGGVVVFRGVAGGDHHPPLGDGVAAKDLVLQKLQHGGGQCFGNAVDFVQKENPLLPAGLLHHVVNRGDNFAHGVFRNAAGFSAVALFQDDRQADGALPGVVGHGMGHKADAQLLGHLLHNGGFANPRRPHQAEGPLPGQGDGILPLAVAGQVGLDGADDLLLGFLDVHGLIPRRPAGRPLPRAFAAASSPAGAPFPAPAPGPWRQRCGFDIPEAWR